MNEPTRESLEEQLARLSREVPPPADLWPAIAGGIRRAPPRSPRFALAVAASLAVCAAGALAWAVLAGRAAFSPTPPAAAHPGFDALQNPNFLAARAALEHSYRERLALLAPDTRAQIESSLTLIRRAHADIGVALNASPASPVLEQLWESTLHDELDLYDRVIRGTQPSITRS